MVLASATGRQVITLGLSLGAIFTTAFAGCRAPTKALRVGSDAATLSVTLANLEPADQGKSGLIYELSGCIPAITGAPSAGNTVTFTAIGLKAALPGCSLKVKTLQASAGIVFAAGSNPNVLYLTNSLTISETPEGNLTATAALQKLYAPAAPVDATQSFTLVVPITFPGDVPPAPITGTLTCDPVIYNLGLYASSAGSGGQFSFTLPLTAETDFSCTSMAVAANGQVSQYTGNFSADVGKFHATPGQTLQLSTALSLTQVAAPQSTPPPATPPPSAASSTTPNISVNTSDGGVCQPPKHYDAVAHTCQ